MFHRNLWIWAALLCAFLSFSNCGNDQKTGNSDEKTSATIFKPIKLFIGEDVSCSVKKLAHLDGGAFDQLEKTIIEKYYFGQISFFLIGDSRGNQYKSIKLGCPEPLCTNALITDISKYKTACKKFERENKQLLHDFFEGCKQELAAAKCEQTTDLNGFLSQASRVFDAPDLVGAAKILLINSDGIHATKPATKLNLALFPEDTHVLISSWDTEQAPNVAGVSHFGQPMHAVDFIISNLLK